MAIKAGRYKIYNGSTWDEYTFAPSAHTHTLSEITDYTGGASYGVATQESDGLMSAEDKQNLDGLVIDLGLEFENVDHIVRRADLKESCFIGEDDAGGGGDSEYALKLGDESVNISTGYQLSYGNPIYGTAVIKMNSKTATGALVSREYNFPDGSLFSKGCTLAGKNEWAGFILTVTGTGTFNSTNDVLKRREWVTSTTDMLKTITTVKGNNIKTKGTANHVYCYQTNCPHSVKSVSATAPDEYVPVLLVKADGTSVITTNPMNEVRDSSELGSCWIYLLGSTKIDIIPS